MAIDTAEKRKAVSGIPILLQGVTPNASKDQEWRQESAWSYPVAIAVVVIVTPITKIGTVPHTSYPSGSAPQGAGTGVIVNLNPDITWQDGSIMTWTTGDPIEWIGATETTPDLVKVFSAPTFAYMGKGEI